MATCANCVNDALYTYRVTDDFGIDYCQYHLPRFLANNKQSGLVTIIPAAPTQTETPVEETPEPVKTSKTKKSTPVVEEPAVEETPVEDAPTEE
jgi:hypothetical protein